VKDNEQHIIDELNKGITPLPSDDYFAQLHANIFSQIETSVPPKIIPLYKKNWFLLSTAASITLIISLALFQGNEPTEKVVAEVDWNSVSREEVLAYVDNNIDDFETEELIKHLDSIPHWEHAIAPESNNDLSQIKEKTSNSTENDELFKDIDKEEILRYLEDEYIELDDELLN